VSNIYADTGTTLLSSYALGLAFSQDGSSLIIGGNFTGYVKVYSVSGTTITFVSNVYADAGTTALSSYARTTCLYPDGTTLIVGGNFIKRAKVYSVSGTAIEFVSDIYASKETVVLSYGVYDASFSPSGDILVLILVTNGAISISFLCTGASK